MRNHTKRRAHLLALALFALVEQTLPAQTVTVSAVGGAAMETSIQVAINSLAAGGSRDDGNATNNVVQIVDSAIYNEALSINALGLVLEGTGAGRPTVIATAAQAAVNTGSWTIRIDSDRAVTIRNLIILPHATTPAAGALVVDEFTGTGGYVLTLEDVLIAGNTGADSPCSTTGLAAPPAGTVRFTNHALDLNSPGSAGTPTVTFTRLVMTGATVNDRDLVRVLTDNGTVAFGEGCVLSFSLGDGVSCLSADNTAISWIGSAAVPIILHGNDDSAISNTGALTRAVSQMQHVAITRNSVGRDVPAVRDDYAGLVVSTWEHVTIAGNDTRDSGAATSGPLSTAGRIAASNCILAGDAMESPRNTGNLILLSGSAQLTGDGTCIDISRGGSSLNVTGDAPLDGVVGGSLISSGAGIINDSPGFWALDPTLPDYLKISNPGFLGAGPLGANLVGAGSFQALPFVGVRTNSGNLQAYILAVAIPDETSTDKFQQTSDDEKMIFREVLDDIAAGRFQSASNRAALVNYDVIIHEDTAQANRRYAILEERSTNRKWGGFFAIDLAPRRQIVVESPHPLFDGTRVQAIDLLFRMNALAFMQSGTHRNNSTALSPCDGTQSNGDPYYISDVAHNADCFFQMAHEQLYRRYADSVSLSVHGMAASSDPSDVVISNGSEDDIVGPSLSLSVADTMNTILTAAADPRYAISHQDPGVVADLAGTTNTQGRFCNGSHNPCGESVQAQTVERFIHMEQDPSVRSGTDPAKWQFVADTYNTLVPNYGPWSQLLQEDGSPILRLPMNGNMTPNVGSQTTTAAGNTAPRPDRGNIAGAALGFADRASASVADFEYDGPDREFSLAFWFRATPGTANSQYLFSHGGIGRSGEETVPSSLHIYLDTATGQLRLRHTVADGRGWVYNGPASLHNDAWHFFTLTCSATVGSTVYLDGAVAGTSTATLGGAFDPEGAIRLAGRTDLSPDHFLAPSSTYNALDALVITNSVLSQAEVTALFTEASNLRVEAWDVP